MTDQHQRCGPPPGEVSTGTWPRCGDCPACDAEQRLADHIVKAEPMPPWKPEPLR